MATHEASLSPLPPLLSLPTELLQNIGRNCSCSTLFNLILVNRRLHEACNHRLVFQHIAETAHQAIRSTPSQWQGGAAFLADSSLPATIRVAYAAEKALELPSVSTKLSKNAFDKSQQADLDKFKWLPHLIALHHPVTIQIHPLYFLDQFQLAQRPTRDEEIVAHYENAAFCLAFATIAWRRTESTANILHSFAEQVRNDRFRRLFGLGRSDAHAVQSFFMESARPLDWITEFQGEHGVAALLFLITLIMQTSPGGATPLPSVHRTPFSTFMDIPPIYHGNPTAFSKCHLAKMCTPNFLSGEWMGFYSDHRWQVDRLDPMMHTILLDSCWNNKQKEEVVIKNTSWGADSHGVFHLEGCIDKDGEVSMTKVYAVQQWRWRWRGRVTPLGIVGVWGNAGFGGYFWIWKKNWIE